MGYADDLEEPSSNRYLQHRVNKVDTKKVTVYLDTDMVEAMDVMIASLKGGASRSDFVRRAMSLYMDAVKK